MSLLLTAQMTEQGLQWKGWIPQTAELPPQHVFLPLEQVQAFAQAHAWFSKEHPQEAPYLFLVFGCAAQGPLSAPEALPLQAFWTVGETPEEALQEPHPDGHPWVPLGVLSGKELLHWLEHYPQTP